MKSKIEPMKPIRVGYGTDVHRLQEGLELTLGGVKIPHSKGEVAHSDGDVLLHALCDALLGALALGDIGKHFPDTDPKYRGIDSRKLLSATMELVEQRGYRVGNVDMMLVLERPKIAPYITAMRTEIASLLGVSVEDVSVKATTNEKMGYLGREDGVEASATVLLFSESFYKSSCNCRE